MMNQDYVFPSVIVAPYQRYDMKNKNEIPSFFYGFELHLTPVLERSASLKKSINAAVYQNASNHFFILYIQNTLGDNEFIFHHDLAPPYTAKSTKKCFREKRIPVLDRSTNSPDANPIENL